jgi:hypothetical protein
LGAVYINLYKVPEVIETASNYLTVGLGAFEALRYLGTNILNYAESYSRGPALRGYQFEEAAGANLGRTFPAFDYYDQSNGVAVQIRSTTQTSSPEALLAVVQRAVNRVNNLPPELKGLDRNGLPLTIDRADIKAKGVLIGIPAKPLPWFGTFLQQVREISESEKVAITVQFVEGRRAKHWKSSSSKKTVMRGYATIFVNRKSGEYIVQPAAKGPVSTTDFGEPIRIPPEKFDDKVSGLVIENLMKYQTQVFDRSLAKRFSSEEYRKFLKKHLAVSLRWEDSGSMTIRPLHPEGGGLTARDGEEIVLKEEEVPQKLVGAILEAVSKAG